MPKMDVQESQLVAFTIISYSGMARALVHEAMEAMRKGEFQLADEKLNEADEQLSRHTNPRPICCMRSPTERKLKSRSSWSTHRII